MLTSDADVERWPAISFRATHGASNAGVIAATAAYRSGQPWLDEVVGYLDGSRALLAELVADQLPGVDYRPPDGTYLAWLDCRSLELLPSAAAFFRTAAGVALVDGEACGGAGSGFVRLNFATPRPLLVDMVARMAAAL